MRSRFVASYARFLSTRLLPLLAAIFVLAPGGQALAASPRAPLNVAGQFKSNADSVQAISNLVPQNLYDAIKSRNLSLMVYTKNFTFSNNPKRNYCWAIVGITTPSPDARGERLAANSTTGIFMTEQDADCRLMAVKMAIDDGSKLTRFAQSKEIAMTQPTGGKAPAEPKSLMLYSAYNEQQTAWLLHRVPPAFSAAFDPRQVGLYAADERFVLGDDVICIGTSALITIPAVDHTPRMPPEIQVATAIVAGGAKMKPADAECQQAVAGGAIDRLIAKPWDTYLVPSVATTREDWSRLPTADSVRASVAQFEKTQGAGKAR